MSRVLMVDNAALFRMLDGSFLRRAGWDISAAHTADDLLARARRQPPDLVLLDSRGGFDAPGCVRLLKRESGLATVPVLVLAEPAEAGSCEAAGAEAVLTHPVVTPAVETALCALARIAPRAGHRRAARLPARVSTPQGSLRGRLLDISASGAFLMLPRPVAAGTALDLHVRLPLPDGGRAVDAPAIVVRATAEEAGSPRRVGVGVRFTGVGGEALSIIDRYVRLDVDIATEGADDAAGDGDGTA
jgi:CheY-like chemotaxis protein